MAKKRSKKRRQSSQPAAKLGARAGQVLKIPPKEEPGAEGKKVAKEAKRSFFDVREEVVKTEDPISAKEQATEPPGDSEEYPEDLKEQDPGSEPTDDSVVNADASPSEDPTTKTKSDGQGDPDEGEGEPDSSNDTTQDDGLHDDFFREGEEVERQHLAQAKAPPKQEDTGESRSALRTSKHLQVRRKKMRKVVAYVLAPAALIAVIAGYKGYNGEGSAAARSNTPVLSVVVQPPHAPTQLASAVPTSHVAIADTEKAESDRESSEDIETDPADESASTPEAGVPEASEVDEQAPREDSADDQETTDRAVVTLPEGVDARREALMALERGKWEEAVELARAALASTPEDASLYLYEGTALQEMGRRTEAREVFTRCVERAKHGPINECRMFAR